MATINLTLDEYQDILERLDALENKVYEDVNIEPLEDDKDDSLI